MQFVPSGGDKTLEIAVFIEEIFCIYRSGDGICHRNANDAEVFGLLPGEPGGAVGYDCDHCFGLPILRNFSYL